MIYTQTELQSAGIADIYLHELVVNSLQECGMNCMEINELLLLLIK